MMAPPEPTQVAAWGFCGQGLHILADLHLAAVIVSASDRIDGDVPVVRPVGRYVVAANA